MSKLSPVMNSMAISDQLELELESPAQVIEHVEPAVPVEGVSGTRSARTRRVEAAEARRRARENEETIVLNRNVGLKVKLQSIRYKLDEGLRNHAHLLSS